MVTKHCVLTCAWTFVCFGVVRRAGGPHGLHRNGFQRWGSLCLTVPVKIIEFIVLRMAASGFGFRGPCLFGCWSLCFFIVFLGHACKLILAWILVGKCVWSCWSVQFLVLSVYVWGWHDFGGYDALADEIRFGHLRFKNWEMDWWRFMLMNQFEFTCVRTVSHTCTYHHLYKRLKLIPRAVFHMLRATNVPRLPTTSGLLCNQDKQTKRCSGKSNTNITNKCSIQLEFNLNTHRDSKNWHWPLCPKHQNVGRLNFSCLTDMLLPWCELNMSMVQSSVSVQWKPNVQQASTHPLALPLFEISAVVSWLNSKKLLCTAHAGILIHLDVWGVRKVTWNGNLGSHKNFARFDCEIGFTWTLNNGVHWHVWKTAMHVLLFRHLPKQSHNYWKFQFHQHVELHLNFSSIVWGTCCCHDVNWTCQWAQSNVSVQWNPNVQQASAHPLAFPLFDHGAFRSQLLGLARSPSWRPIPFFQTGFPELGYIYWGKGQTLPTGDFFSGEEIGGIGLWRNSFNPRNQA